MILLGKLYILYIKQVIMQVYITPKDEYYTERNFVLLV